MLPVHNTSPFRSVVSVTTVTAFINSAVKGEKELAEFTVALCEVDTHKATQLSVLLKSETILLFKVAYYK